PELHARRGGGFVRPGRGLLLLGARARRPARAALPGGLWAPACLAGGQAGIVGPVGEWASPAASTPRDSGLRRATLRLSEELAELLHAEAHAALRRAERHRGAFGDLGGGQLTPEGQQHGLALRLREQAQGPDQHRALSGALG